MSAPEDWTFRYLCDTFPSTTEPCAWDTRINKTKELPPERLARGENRQTAPTLGASGAGRTRGPLHLQEPGCVGRPGAL